MPLQAVLAAFPSHATAPEASALGRGVRMTFAKGVEIFGQDETVDLIYTLVSGAVRTTCFQADGRRQIGDFYYAGDLIGIETGARHRFCAEALTDCVVTVIKRASLMANSDPTLTAAVWHATRRELERTQEHMLLLGYKNACERVAGFLNDVAQRQGGGIGELSMGRQDMADYLGLTIETVSRMLTQLQAAGSIKFLTSRTFRITCPQALEQLAA